MVSVKPVGVRTADLEVPVWDFIAVKVRRIHGDADRWVGRITMRRWLLTISPPPGEHRKETNND